ncbi:nucleoid occlusion factor SlmA [Desulfosporosinus acididurans]|uniref:Nucleoid occlusion factor SlmA n=1 Tax=Desulfosporosinus acididurans TaxID=476652 RepID=A0A0J1FP72_9FIRM|nr:TetR/AcrR family transcriptional regulator [Desulfosporosinus acididurans]KLU65295.1 nucleoid occlusion factor SlmA [Desulfosporosinus acididurans]
MQKKENSMNQSANNQQTNADNFANNSKSLRADAKQNREQILEAAHKSFAQKGLSIPISEIASQAGVGIGTLYRHFPTKEALFEAVNISYKQQLTKKAKSLATHADPGKAFFDFFSSIIKDGFTNRALKEAFKSGAFNTRAANFGVIQDFHSAYATLLIRAQQAKAVREDIDVQDLGTLLIGLLRAIEQQGDATDINRFHRLLSIAIEGLRYKD